LRGDWGTTQLKGDSLTLSPCQPYLPVRGQPNYKQTFQLEGPILPSGSNSAGKNKPNCSVHCINTNPIVKKEVVVYYMGTNLHIDPVAVALGVDENHDPGINVQNNGPNNQALLAQMNAIWLQASEVINTLRTQHEVMKEELQQLRRIVARFANRPAQVSGGFLARRQPVVATVRPVGDDDDGEDDAVIGGPVGEHPREYAVSLSNCPRNLYELWEEYEFGLNGQKPAKRFTRMRKRTCKIQVYT
jgi:hypothetical protein